MKLSVISVFSFCLLTCFGCDGPSQESAQQQETQAPKGTALIHIVPRKLHTDSDPPCNDSGFYKQPHYYELYLDDKLVYRDRLKAEYEDDDLTKWQLSLGKHQLRISAEGFVSFDKPIEVVAKTQASSTQRFTMVLDREEAVTEKKADCP